MLIIKDDKLIAKFKMNCPITKEFLINTINQCFKDFKIEVTDEIISSINSAFIYKTHYLTILNLCSIEFKP